MEWLRSHHILNKQPRALMSSAEEECDPQACYDSFKEHWHQALKIINRTQQLPKNDDVLGVVNHFEQMVTLLLYDLKKIDQLRVPISSSSKCLEYMLGENILDKLFEWGLRAGKFKDAVRCEQLKLYEVLVSRSRHVLLVHEPFLRPLIKLLNSCNNELFSREIEKLLVDLLNQLCALLMQNIDLIDLFFQKEQNGNKFIIFNLLIPFVHREDSIGMRARDGLLLCMSLSKKNKDVASYIVSSNFAVLAASGLNGLYSLLPNALDDIQVPDWRRLTPDDVNDIKGLATFVTSLEFSNAVAQVAHPLIRKQLQEFLFRGFLIPVLGPALLQTVVEEQVAATAYLELILRTVTQPGLLYAMLKFLINMEYDGVRLLDMLIQRISSDKELCLVSLSLFETMVELNCEDMMLELIFQHLQPCLHLMLSQRRSFLPLDPHCQSFEKLLNLAPICCDLPASPKSDIHWNHYSNQQTLCGKYHAYLYDARNKIASCQAACQSWSNAYTGCDDIQDTTTTEENCNSLSSLGESSGYESLKLKIEDNEENLPIWQISSTSKIRKTNALIDTNDHLNTSGSAGPFLTILLEKLKNFLSNSFYINLQVTGLISRLAVYPQPLLRTYLLDDSLVLQPNVPSLFQIIGSLKQGIDEYMSRRADSVSLIKSARDFLVDRETRLLNARRSVTTPERTAQDTTESQPFQRNEPKRRSLNLPSITSMFGRRPSQIAETNMPLPQLILSSNHREESSDALALIYPKFNEAQHVALCAVLLDEWLKELAALAQEHTIAQLAALFK